MSEFAPPPTPPARGGAQRSAGWEARSCGTAWHFGTARMGSRSPLWSHRPARLICRCCSCCPICPSTRGICAPSLGVRSW